MLSRICFPVFRKAHKASYTHFVPGVLIRPTSKTSIDLMLFTSNVQTGSQHSCALGLPSRYHSSLSGYWFLKVIFRIKRQGSNTLEFYGKVFLGQKSAHFISRLSSCSKRVSCTIRYVANANYKSFAVFL